jgi:hypothetical protein
MALMLADGLLLLHHVAHGAFLAAGLAHAADVGGTAAAELRAARDKCVHETVVRARDEHGVLVLVCDRLRRSVGRVVVRSRVVVEAEYGAVAEAGRVREPVGRAQRAPRAVRLGVLRVRELESGELLGAGEAEVRCG